MIFSDGRGGSVVRFSRRRLVDLEARRTVIRAMLIMRERGYTDSEIGLIYGFHRVTVNRMINAIPRDVRRRMIDVGLV